MNRKHLALNYNINAILDKSEPERKTFLDRMVEEKKETERLLKKLKPFASQERIDKLNEQLQVLNTKIEQVKNTLSLAILNDPQRILAQIGDVFDTHFDDGTKTSFAVITAEGLNSLLGKKEILRVINDSNNGSPNTNKTYAEYSDNDETGIIKNGYIVNLDFYQQVALLGAIEKKTGVNNKIGFYNLNGGDCVHKTNAAKLWRKKEIGGFWTGEEYLNTHVTDPYNQAGIVYLGKKFLAGLKKVEHFAYRDINDVVWSNKHPSYCSEVLGVVLGMVFESGEELNISLEQKKEKNAKTKNLSESR